MSTYVASFFSSLFRALLLRFHHGEVVLRLQYYSFNIPKFQIKFVVVCSVALLLCSNHTRAVLRFSFVSVLCSLSHSLDWWRGTWWRQGSLGHFTFAVDRGGLF